MKSPGITFEILKTNHELSGNFKLVVCPAPDVPKEGQAAYKSKPGTLYNWMNISRHPHKNFKTIHVAGTNGKGSVSHMLASILQQAGYKTGLYTSPHLKDFRKGLKSTEK